MAKFPGSIATILCVGARQCGKSEALEAAALARADEHQRVLSMKDSHTYEIQPGLDYLRGSPELSMIRTHPDSFPKPSQANRRKKERRKRK